MVIVHLYKIIHHIGMLNHSNPALILCDFPPPTPEPTPMPTHNPTQV